MKIQGQLAYVSCSLLLYLTALLLWFILLVNVQFCTVHTLEYCYVCVLDNTVNILQKTTPMLNLFLIIILVDKPYILEICQCI